MREKKVQNFQPSWRILEKKNNQPIKFNKTQSSILKNGRQQRQNSFRLPSRVNEDFIRNLICQHHHQQQHQQNINQQQQNINQFTSGVSKYT